jgi:hypothetical protein
MLSDSPTAKTPTPSSPETDPSSSPAAASPDSPEMAAFLAELREQSLRNPFRAER